MEQRLIALGLVSLSVFLLLAPASAAEEPTSSEKRFLKSLVAGLTDDSAAVRSASEEALVLMDAKGAWYLVDQIKRLKTGALEAAVRVLIRIGGAALEQIELLEKHPTGKAGMALEEVLRAFVGDGGEGGFGVADPAVTARVKEIMSTVPRDSWGPDEPALVKLVSIGRPAIPAILPYLSPGADRMRGMIDLAAASALGKICDSGDTMRLALLLDKGWLKIASVMRDVNDPACVNSLVRALREGRVSHDVGSALQHFADPASRSAAVQFLTERGTSFPNGTSCILELAENLRATEALTAIRRILATPAEHSMNRNRQRMYCAKAMARLGDKDGIPVLISLLVLPRDDEWMTRWVGEALNGVSGQTFWSEGGSAGTAKTSYEDWWQANGADLVWNETARCFQTE